MFVDKLKLQLVERICVDLVQELSRLFGSWPLKVAHRQDSNIYCFLLPLSTWQSLLLIFYIELMPYFLSSRLGRCFVFSKTLMVKERVFKINLKN